MRRMPVLLLALLLSLCAASALLGDEFVLLDGRRVAGPVLREEERSVTVLTLDGPLSIERADVVSVTPAERLEERLAALANAADARGLCLAVGWALRHGLFEEAWTLADEARLAGLPASALPADLARAPLGAALLPPLDDEAVRLLSRIAARGGPARRERARRLLGEHLDPRRHAQCVRLLLSGSHPEESLALLRAAPVAVLQAVSDLLRSLPWRRDRPAGVRAAAAQRAYEVIGEPVLADVARVLEKGDGRQRLLALDAADAIGSRRLAGSLVRHLRRAQEGRPRRAHLRSGTETSYVRDFDVEVAQAAVAARPLVGVVRHGTVLDVGIVGVTERRIPRSERARCARILARITGVDLGADWRRWDAWLRRH